MAYWWVALGSALGGVTRYWVSQQVGQRLGEAFPWGTLCINVVGSLLIGILAAMTLPEGRMSQWVSAKPFLMVGFLGGFTTFSAFSLQTLQLIQQGSLMAALWNVVMSVVLCLGAVTAGFWVAKGM